MIFHTMSEMSEIAATSITGLRVFVVMPFGQKMDATGQKIDFDRVYRELIEPAISKAGADVFRADFENRAGNVLSDMFQELLLADLVIADVTIDNPNAWYELGVRHALRARGTIMIRGNQTRIPFDIGPERVLKYALIDGEPDPAKLDLDRRSLLEAVLATADTDVAHKDSPVFGYLPHLEEPGWRHLRVGEINAAWLKLREWEAKIEAATECGQPGDILVLADEPPVRFLRFEALRTATSALLKLGRNKLCLKIAEEALKIAPNDIVVRQKLAICHERLGNLIRARQILQDLEEDKSPEAQAALGETLGLYGRVAKTQWRARANLRGRWHHDTVTNGFLGRACELYAEAFRLAPTNYFAGINAVGLGRLYQQVAGRNPAGVDLDALMHGVRWALSCAMQQANQDHEDYYWILATQAELCVLDGDAMAARDAYANAAVHGRAWFYLDSSLQQLLLFHENGLAPDATNAGIQILMSALAHSSGPKPGPERVILFSGHMIDDPAERGPAKEKAERFPAHLADAVRAAISNALDDFGVARNDIGFCGGACGGDLIFADECLKRGLGVHVYIPTDEDQFLASSVGFAGGEWTRRFFSIVNRTDGTVCYRIQPQELGPVPKNGNQYGRNNRWLAYSAMSYGLDRLRVLCLWNGEPGDGPGGTKDMIDFVGEVAGSTPRIINPRLL